MKPPSASTFQSFAPSQASKFLPLKSTTASEGGPLPSPGVTTGGSGQTIPLSQRWAKTWPVMPSRQKTSVAPSRFLKLHNLRILHFPLV